MKYLTILLFLCTYSYADCTSSNIGVYDSKGVLVSSHTQTYKAIDTAVTLAQKDGKATIKTPDIICTSKTSSTASSSQSSQQSSVQSSSAPAGSWIRRADFEGVLGAVATGSDGFTGTTKATISDEVPAVSGSKVARVHIPAGCGGCFGTWGGIIDFPTALKKGDEVRIKLSIYWPSGFNTDAKPHLKFLRVRTLQSNGQNGGYDDIYIPVKTDATPFKFIYEGEQVWSYFGTPADRVQYDVWETYEYYIKFDSVPKSQGGMAVVEFWKNGIRLARIEDRRTLNDTWTANNFYLFTYWNGEDSPAQHVYVDDITVTGVRQ